MSKIKLRPYQQEAVDKTMDALRASPAPVVLEASVGAGKSIMVGVLMGIMENNGRRALCLTASSELVDQNAEKYKAMGYQPSVFCASLGKKQYQRPCMFASPQSLWSAIKKGHEVSAAVFDLLCVDEAQNINDNRDDSVYMSLINHYLQNNPKMRIVGLTGTPFRLAGSGSESIVGPNKLFKSFSCQINMARLIDMGFLVPPRFGSHKVEAIDYSDVKLTGGRFKASDIDKALAGRGRLTSRIIAEVVEECRDSGGAFIFGATIDHCNEIMESLPPQISAMVTGKTPDKKRQQIMRDARAGKIKYLVNVNCLTVGVDLPRFDTVVWLRPTESLNLYLQGIGRGVRLHEGKTACRVLDYAGNAERHGDIDDPVINNAVEYTPKGDPKVELDCPSCDTVNPLSARRCIGRVFNQSTQLTQRCEYYFEFIECQHCQAQNDIAARNCRVCGGEILDPNRKLKMEASRGMEVSVPVIHASYRVHEKNGSKLLRCDYLVSAPSLGNPTVSEFYNPNATGYTRQRFLDEFVRQHIPGDIDAMTADTKELFEMRDKFRKPHTIHIKKKPGSQYFDVMNKEF